jgi:K+-sensing histidine kinase KdpD
MNNDTFFASSHRNSEKEVIEDNANLLKEEYVSIIINALPEIAAILNTDRQIVFSNDALMNFLGIIDKNGLLGLRPGEAVKCINSALMEAGCGTSENCRYCGAVNAIVESQKTNEKVTKECRITSIINDKHEFLDLKVTSTPFVFKDKNFSILSVDDISDVKRRTMLERIFFHDIINIAGGLKGFSELLKETPDPSELKNYINIVDRLSNELLEEILSQRALTNAENGELEPTFSNISSLDLLNDAITYLSVHSVAVKKKMQILEKSIDVRFKTDDILLKRVLINMLKNALEASEIDQTVNLNCTKDNNYITFSVQNSKFMPRAVQLQVFQRSFSTKGSNRGLGTYSIKLLTERYLKGKVGFETSTENGTTFYVKIPEILN